MIERQVPSDVLVALAELTQRGYGDVRPVASVEDVARRILKLDADEPVPGTKNAHVALALKDARKQGLAEYGSHMRHVNLGYCITDRGEEIVGTVKHARARIEREVAQVDYENAMRSHFRQLACDLGQVPRPEVSPHPFKPLQRLRNRGRCDACLAHEFHHPTVGWVPARALREKTEAFLP